MNYLDRSLKSVSSRIIPVQPFDQHTARLQFAFQFYGNRRLARAGQPGEPQCKALRHAFFSRGK